MAKRPKIRLLAIALYLSSHVQQLQEMDEDLGFYGTSLTG